MERVPEVAAALKTHCVARVHGEATRVVHPSHFYSARSPLGGQGLFCNVDLCPGDIWWAHDLSDRRYVSRVIPWDEYLSLRGEERHDAERLCYVDPAIRALVICTEPFCRVNHAYGTATNADSDTALNSVIAAHVPAHAEILMSYEYEAVVSLLWKFPELRSHLSAESVKDESFLLSPVVDCPDVLTYLRSLGQLGR